MGEIIAFANQKGGVGKTTCCHALATVKAIQGKKVLLIDLDSQGSLSICVGASSNTGDCSVTSLFEKGFSKPQTLVQPTKTGLDNLYIIPSNIDLSFVPYKIFKSAERELILKKVLKKGFTDTFDYVFLDCAPNINLVTLNGLCLADSLVICSKVDYISFKGLKSLMETYEDIVNPKNHLNPKLKLKGVIGTMYEKGIRDQRDILEIMQDEFPFMGTVKKSADVYRDIIACKSVCQTNPKSEVAKQFFEIGDSL